MPRDFVKVIKRVVAPFDAEIVALEANTVKDVFRLYAARCNDVDAAKSLADVFSELGSTFTKKLIALDKQIM